MEVLHIDECPNWHEAGRRTESVLRALGHADVKVSYRLLASPEEASQTVFAGSPTIAVNGEDLFPSDRRTADLACRVYVTPTGLAGLPTEEQIREALDAVARTRS